MAGSPGPAGGEGATLLAGARRVLALRLDNLGDVLMLTPALRALRRALPEAELTLMASPGGAAAAPLLPWVDAVMPERVVWQDASGSLPLDPGRELALLERLRRGAFDAALVFTSFAQSPHPPAYACYLAGIPVRVGESKEFGGGVLSHPVPPTGDEAHQVERNLRLLDACGVPRAGDHLELAVPPDDQSRADDLLRAVGVDPTRPFAVLAPGASAPSRRYPPPRFAAVARRLRDRLGLPAVVIGGRRDAAPAQEVVAEAEGAAASLVERTSVPEMAGVIGRGAVVVTNNSAPMHVADALGRPLVALFAGTELEEQWRPRRAPARLLRRPTPCAPCYRFDCPYHLACLDIAPEAVADAAAAGLGRPDHPSGGDGPGPARRPHVARPRELPALPLADPS